MSFVNARGRCVIVLLMRALGFSHCALEGKVVGGKETTITKFPHSIFLNARCGTSEFICGASVLNQIILLTAAHCVYDCNFKKKHTIEAYGGHEDFRKKVYLRKVIRRAVHRGYEEEEVLNDIALAKVDNNFPLNDIVKKVIIPLRYPNTKTATVAGWGLINEITQASSNVLKSVAQTLRSRKKCSMMIGSLHSGMFCAGSTNSEDDHPSAGDSGSALITSDFKQIGLVSFRLKSVPALMVYTNVTYYYDWIKRNSKHIYCM